MHHVGSLYIFDCNFMGILLFFRRFRKNYFYPAHLHMNDTYLSERGSSRSCCKNIFHLFIIILFDGVYSGSLSIGFLQLLYAGTGCFKSYQTA